MRIALDATYSVGRDLSGVGVYCRELIAGLARSQPESRFVLCYRPHRLLRSFRESLPSNCSRYVLHDAMPLPAGDLFHGLNQRLPAKRARRVVTTFHDLFVLTAEYSTVEFRHRFAEQARHAAASSDLIIAVSRFTAEQVRDLLEVDEGRIRVIHHGVPTPPDGFVRNPERMVLHVGAIQTRKNIQRLVSAFEMLPDDWTLVFAGSSGHGAAEILSYLEKSPARARIRMAGYVARPDLEILYSRASLLAFPSLDEGFGIPVIEAMARGVPVVTSNRSALKEVAGDAALLVDPEDVEQIGEAMLRLCTDEPLYKDKVKRGYQRAQEFTWKTAIAKTWAVYRELA